MDSLEFARDLWREFGLNDSRGAGMTLTTDGIVTKKHGYQFSTQNLKEMPASIVHYKKPQEKVRK